MSGVVRFIGYVDRVEGDTSVLRISPEYAAGLEGFKAGDRLLVLYWLHLRDNEEHRSVVRVVPRRHGETEPRGVFTTRSPSRPNPIGLTEVELVSAEGGTLTVRGLDALEGSPVIDLKPSQH
jgi:tRNA-Thr(GGU) m(6)t(6)A37 methyltransferase TsaA